MYVIMFAVNKKERKNLATGHPPQANSELWLWVGGKGGGGVLCEVEYCGGRECTSISGEIRESTAGKSANLLL